ncbi:MAG: nuclear transport factor 2 family protein [Myxococcota bacterium]
MTPPITRESARIIEDYLRAKDAQVPHLYRRVFTEDARFVATYDMPSPFGDDGPRDGLAAIASGFRKMGQMCENIVTVVPVDSLDETSGSLSSRWVVAMTRRDGAGGFVGWGSYRWSLDVDAKRATELAVRFEGMQPLDTADEADVFDALLDLPHPWCTREQIERAASATTLAPLLAWLAEGSA